MMLRKAVGLTTSSLLGRSKRFVIIWYMNFITTDKIQAVIEVGKTKQNAFSQYPENTSVIN